MKVYLINRKRHLHLALYLTLKSICLCATIHTFIINLQALAVQLQRRFSLEKKNKLTLFFFFPPSPKKLEIELFKQCEAQIFCGMLDTFKVPVAICHIIEFSGLCLAFTGK